MRIETFYATLWKTGDSLVATVPSNIVRHSDLEAGNKVIITLKKEVLKNGDDKEKTKDQ